MARLPVAVARVRTAVRDCLADQATGARIVVACSGGPDSMALAAATAFVAPRLGLQAILITVDHRLQSGSDARAAGVVEWARRYGFHAAEAVTVDVDPRDGGPEAAARQVRYAALETARQRHDAATVLLGHTQNDQAETVLLALARGSGPRGIAAMPRDKPGLRRPLLDISRADTVAACAELELATWDDPHNSDDSYTRSRLRTVMPNLTEALGERVIANLAHTAELIAADTEVLDDYAEQLRREATTAASNLAISPLAAAPKALRTRCLRSWMLDQGTRSEDLASVHIAAVDALVMRWHGQKPANIPGGVTVGRVGDELHANTTPERVGSRSQSREAVGFRP